MANTNNTSTSPRIPPLTAQNPKVSTQRHRLRLKPRSHQPLQATGFRNRIQNSTRNTRYPATGEHGARPRSGARALPAMHICEPWEFSYGVTNWCNAWHGVDFSAASIKSSEDSVASTTDEAVPAPLVFGHSLERNHPNRCKFVIFTSRQLSLYRSITYILTS
jgi:hypothetical protein